MPGKAKFGKERLERAFCEGQQAQAAGALRAAPHQTGLPAYNSWLAGFDAALGGNYESFCGFYTQESMILTTLGGEAIVTSSGQVISI